MTRTQMSMGCGGAARLTCHISRWLSLKSPNPCPVDGELKGRGLNKSGSNMFLLGNQPEVVATISCLNMLKGVCLTLDLSCPGQTTASPIHGNRATPGGMMIGFLGYATHTRLRDLISLTGAKRRDLSESEVVCRVSDLTIPRRILLGVTKLLL